MIITDYINPDDLQMISQVDELRGALEIFAAARKKLEDVDTALKCWPQENGSDARKDWRYQLGMIAGIQWVLDLPTKARDYLEYCTKEDFSQVDSKGKK